MALRLQIKDWLPDIMALRIRRDCVYVKRSLQWEEICNRTQGGGDFLRGTFDQELKIERGEKKK